MLIILHFWQVLHRLWVNRTRLHEEMEEHNIPPVESSSEEDYQRLINSSEAWWAVMRLLKVSRIRSRFRLSISKSFTTTGSLNSAEPVDQVSTHKAPVPSLWGVHLISTYSYL